MSGLRRWRSQALRARFESHTSAMTQGPEPRWALRCLRSRTGQSDIRVGPRGKSRYGSSPGAEQGLRADEPQRRQKRTLITP